MSLWQLRTVWFSQSFRAMEVPNSQTSLRSDTWNFAWRHPANAVKAYCRCAPVCRLAAGNKKKLEMASCNSLGPIYITVFLFIYFLFIFLFIFFFFFLIFFYFFLNFFLFFFIFFLIFFFNFFYFFYFFLFFSPSVFRAVLCFAEEVFFGLSKVWTAVWGVDRRQKQKR